MLSIETFHYTDNLGWSLNHFPDFDSKQTVVFVFAATSFQLKPAAIQELQAFYKTSHLIGCSTSGEIFQDTVSDDSLVVAVMRCEHTQIKSVFAHIDSRNDSHAAGQKITEQLLSPNLTHVFILSDGLHVNGTELVSGIMSNLPAHVKVTGGLAGDGDRFKTTWTLSDQGIQSHCVVAIGFYGKHFKVACSSQGGWDTFGLERLITKSEKNVLYEIDDQPALDLYKSYLGERANELPAAALLFPMAIRAHAEEMNPIVRTILAVDEIKKSMTFAGDMPVGWLAQLMTANFERLIDGAANAGKNACFYNENTNLLTLAISCVGRKLVLGERIEEEVEAVLDMLPASTKQVGFYSYGEISPLGLIQCGLHNQTMTLTSFAEI